jgi:hypothetical protein
MDQGRQLLDAVRARAAGGLQRFTTEGRAMKNRLLIVVGTFLAATLLASPVRGWQVSAEEHANHHPDAQPADPKSPAAPQAKGPAAMNMMASNAKLDALAKKMNAAQGQAKVDAMAELLTVLVQTHQAMHNNMSAMMQNKDGAHGK